MSASDAASTARHAPCPAAVTNRNADSISMMVWRTLPPPKCRPAPRARLWNPAATAERWSASSRVSPRDAATSRPSADSTTACSACLTRPTRSSSNHRRSLAEPVFCATDVLSLPLAGIAGRVLIGNRRVLGCVLGGYRERAATHRAALVRGHHPAHLLRRAAQGRWRVGVGGRRLVGVQRRGEVGLAYPF